MSLTIHTPIAMREVAAFRVRQDASPRALRAEKMPDSSQRVFFGDRGFVPSPLGIEVEVQETTIEATRTEIAAILGDAQTAIGVTTPRGYRPVDGLLTHRARFNGRAATLGLTFAPTSGSYFATDNLARETPTQDTSGVITSTNTLGWEFIPRSDVTVTALRLRSHLDQPGDVEIALWRSVGSAQIGAMTVSDFGADEWVEVPIHLVGAEELINEIELEGGKAYVVTARLTSGTSLGVYISDNADVEIDFSPHLIYLRGRTAASGFPDTHEEGRWYSVGARFHEAVEPAYAPESYGLRGDYRFNTGAGLLLPDLSGLDHDGTISGALWGSSPTGLDFDGVDDEVEMPAELLPTGDISMVLALRYDGPDAEASFMGLLYGTNHGLRFHRHPTTGEVAIRSYDGTTTRLVSDPQALATGETAVYCATYRRSDGAMQIARDGGAFTEGDGVVLETARTHGLFGTSEFRTHYAECRMYAALVYSHRLSMAKWRDLYQEISGLLTSRGAI